MLRKKKLHSADILDEKSRADIRALLSMYPNDYKFQKDSILCDVVARPTNHFKAFYKLAQFFESEKLKQFDCFPLRTSVIPTYITLDTKIVNYHIIKSKKPVNNKTKIWEKVISGDLKKKPFKNQGTEKSLRFKGTTETDGVGVSIIKQNMAITRKKISTTVAKKNPEPKNDDTKYIESLTQVDSANTSEKCVSIDPGQRDLLYSIKETSTAQRK
ncbi:hypothetical protein BDF21DRAFT_456498 [Thamnidium elegans]|nr:hypothetical protein BDF21DRAFT_456498 [Thamnidium elegans]